MIVGLLKYRSATKPFKLIIIYFLVCLVTEGFATSMSMMKMNNSLVGDIFYIIEGIILLGFYYLVFGEKEFFIPAIIIGIAYVIYGLYTSAIDPGPWVYNANFRAGESLMIQALSAYALIRISKEEDVHLLSHPGFWISSGFFIYFSVNIVVFVSASFIVEGNIFLTKHTWFIHSLVNLLAYIIFTFGLLCIPSLQRK